ncbi:dienelactone hydrolase family protein [Ralstonia solanacearum]|uniref:dienelactone hydrolase family protein n=1 Tax=Ralstonia solanacearum TaxID=305 RepID=UPI000AE2319D|nr:alpha/beta hydrolase [Ralstonia solanacearum]
MTQVNALAFEIVADDAVLQGDLVCPEHARGLVLFAHGSGSSRLSPRNRFVAGQLNEAGLGTLLFDLLSDDEARHVACRFDIDLLAERLRIATHAVGYLVRERGLRLGYLGASTGAAAAIRAATARDDDTYRIDAVVSRGGRPDLAGRAALQALQAPTLLIVGGMDTEVLRLNDSCLRRMRCEKALEVVPGATHLFEEPGTLEQVARLARDWFSMHLHRQGEPAPT